ncbi:arsenate reductase-like glutaredoxin family protein [Pacificibacter maritimus]|uniref:Arsenate reductase-like glutaredoxin family protein n=1 Tax=Pacificibacter maritimus TaxID=762213 RepID=A0A3N4ULX0_9RHOB|nr:ArsC/Spx/MgsR family protein [Pacificibacter maritimus]RPE70998.1 arsenate reductase-like glutaredoxin family protein [Pacificibacter maritimus]
MTKLYGIKACDTCRKAAKTLAVDISDIRANPLPASDLKRFYAQFGDALVNTRSTTWRGLSEAERARPPLDLLSEHPTLMKRPVIEKDGALFLGWGKDVQAELGV